MTEHWTERWTTEQVASFLEITPARWRSYVAMRQPKGNPAPKPDGHYDRRTPWWYPETVMEWKRRRPGRGNWATDSEAASA